MGNKISIKMTEENLNFLKRIAVNRIKADIETGLMTPSQSLTLIEKYFKLDNDGYVDMINLEDKKNECQ